MKRFALFFVAVLAFGVAGAARCGADDLIVNGSFALPDVGGNWSMEPNGSVPGWFTTDTAGLIEIDNPAVFGGGSSAYAGNQGDQSLEVNANYPEDVFQTVSNLVVGEQYTLFWAYGDRPDSGDEELQVYFGPSVNFVPADLVATDYDYLDGSNSAVLWYPNTAVVTATSATEVLSFNAVYDNGIYDNGGESYGNEIDAVSLMPTPEPSTLLLFASGLGLLFSAWRRRRALPVPGNF
ncbi:MAG: PEP-CTERM sorting domain-containing protein [Terracidiphilus sp.]